MNLACNDRNLFFSKQENASNVNKYFVDEAIMESKDAGIYLSIISKKIKENSLILDVGCAQGKLGKKVKDKNCTLIGIDINQAAIEYVQQQGLYKDAFICDVTQTECEAFKRVQSYGPYDHIVILDILEHLMDPTRVLMELRKILKEDGSILVSIPNIANSDICLNLLNGRFNYGSLGILDNTHVKFFTRPSFHQWIEQICDTFPDQKLYATYLGSSYYVSEYVREIEKKHPGLAHILNTRPESEAFQLLFMLSTKPVQDEEQQDIDFDCVEVLGEWLDNRFNAQRVPMLQSERAELKRLLQNKDEWIASQQQQVDYLTKVGEDKDEHIRQCEQVIQSKEEAIAAKDEWIASQQQQVDYLTKVGEDKDEHIRQCEQVIQSKEEAIA
ncbi:MAG: methyltransferase domain-containing protein, partial [Clostridia bacterium]|nr:methyltransferase domain-containing protein [Clostridia bacterium]